MQTLILVVLLQKVILMKIFFASNQIKLEWMDYSGYKTYNQLHPPFKHEVSIIDLIFNEGANAKKFLKSYFE